MHAAHVTLVCIKCVRARLHVGAYPWRPSPTNTCALLPLFPCICRRRRSSPRWPRGAPRKAGPQALRGFGLPGPKAQSAACGGPRPISRGGVWLGPGTALVQAALRTVADM